MDEDELEGAVHPAADPELTGLDGEEDPLDVSGPPAETRSNSGPQGQYREPFEYGAILKSLGLKLDDHEIAVRYYRERAAAHLVRFPARAVPESVEPLAEGLHPWDVGSPLEDADWLESVLVSPRVIPGLTTVQRAWGTMEGAQPERRPIDLDLYVDCSGSMPDPRQTVSYLTLAGTIIALSALRVGSRVQATLWSGAREFQTTRGFVRDEAAVLRILTGYLGGGTAFPIHMLRETYENRKPSERPVHILVISDDGVTTMYDRDERGRDGWEIAGIALEKARAGGSLVLNLPGTWEMYPALRRAAAQGWRIHRVRSWEELVDFARAFSSAAYGEEEGGAPGRTAS